MWLAFDIGATHTRLSLTDGRSLIRPYRFDTISSARGIEHMLGEMEDYIRHDRVTAAAGGLPGQLDRQTGRLLHAPNLPGWINQRVGRQIAQTLGVPLEIHNDAAVVGLGEAVYGAGRGGSVIAYLTVSTGINGARIVNGSIDEGARGIEVGDELVEGSDRKLHSIEALAGGAALQHRYHLPPSALHRPALWHRESQYLSQAIHNLVIAWSPDRIVMGGSMMRDISTDEIAANLGQWPGVYNSWPPIVRGELGDDGGLYGAMALLKASRSPLGAS